MPVTRRGTTWNRTSALSTTTIGAIILRDDWQCAYCQRRIDRDDLTLDHVVPRSKGGSNRADNLVLAHGDCNIARGDSPVTASVAEEIARRVALPIDMKAGRALGDELYPWAANRRRAQAEAQRRLEENRRREAASLGGTAFPFGALAEAS